MTYQNDPIGALEEEMAAVEDELEKVMDTITAGEILLGVNQDALKYRTMSVRGAARVLAESDLSGLPDSDVSGMTLPQIVSGMKNYKQSLDEEWYNLDSEMGSLIVVNHDRTTKWVRQEIDKALSNPKEPGAPLVRAAEESRIETLRACLAQLEDIKPDTEHKRKPCQRK